jgi:rhamnulokinase
LNRLTAEATGLELIRGNPESSTVSNFAIQIAVLEGAYSQRHGVDPVAVAHWAGILGDADVAELAAAG